MSTSSEDDTPLVFRRKPPAVSTTAAAPSPTTAAPSAAPASAQPRPNTQQHSQPVAPRQKPAAANPEVRRPLVNDDSDDEDDQLLLKRANTAKPSVLKHDQSDSDSDVPLSQRTNGGLKAKPAAQKSAVVKKPAAPRPAPAKQPEKRKPVYKDDDDDDDEEGSSDEASSDDEPLAGRSKRNGSKPRASSAPRSNTRPSRPPAKKPRTESAKANGKGGDGVPDIKWTTLEHCGVLFPPEYVPHGVKMLYDGKPVHLTPDQEEVATMFAVMLETDYMQKPQFLRNFWEGFKEVLGRDHVIKSLEKCDFRAIYDWHMTEREKKKELTKEEKEAIKKEREASEAQFKNAMVDGRVEPVGNFRVEPPGLFRGRGEHPKMGKIKKRIYPKDITINIGKGAKVPEHPYPEQTWKEVRHDRSVTWLAFWKDTVSGKDFKYVWLGATSSFKADSDLLKYEKARKLKEYIGTIRENYERDWDSRDMKTRQMATALYFIDKLALRAGHEKDDDEADTVGCCTLKVENVGVDPPHHIRFDFLGKDSIRYENSVEVHPKVYKAVEHFMRMDVHGKQKKAGAQLFDAFDATDLNKELKSLMDGLSVKVFRTYNASITLDRLLTEAEASSSAVLVDEKKAEYDIANKEVAILCNHQRSVPKAHGTQMEKMAEKLGVLQEELDELEEELKLAKKGKAKEAGKKPPAPETVVAKIARKQEQMRKAQVQVRSKEDLKTVSLNTSKINYMDPRISVAWCKRNEVPIEKVFNKSLLAKFAWAMETEPSFKF